MYYPTETKEFLIIYCLGFEDENLYASSIVKKIFNQKYCSRQVINESERSYYYSIKKLIKEDIITETGKDIKTEGAKGILLELTKAGELIYDEIKDLYPILEYIMPFQELIYECDICTEGERERCLEIQKKDLEITLKNLYQMKLDTINSIIRELNATVPMSLGEFIFWLTMNKVSEKRLIDKYATFFQIINSHINK